MASRGEHALGSSPKAAAGSAQELPTRYVCHVCGVCVGTSENLLETREDMYVFSGLFAGASAERASASKTVVCPGCDAGLGSRGENAVVMLRRDRALKKTERLEILVCSLKQQEINELTPVLQSAFPHSNVSSRVLMKAELRGLSLTGHRPTPEFVVVAHRNEGRALLTDRNGFYHDLLGSAWQMTRGNVLLLLSRTELKAESDLVDQQLVRSLANQGDQPTVGALGAMGRVLMWQTTPSAVQIRHLQMLIGKAYFREPSAQHAPGIPGQWTRPPQRQASHSWCQLL